MKQTINKLLHVSTVIILLTLISTTGFAVDFGELENREGPRDDSQRHTLLQQRNILWEGEPEDLLFEVASLEQSLVWVSATSNTLHVTVGNRIGVFPGDLTKKMPGKILALNTHSMPHLPNKILISATMIQGNQLITHLLSYDAQRGELGSFHESSMEAINPLNRFLYAQDYAPGNGWGSSIYQLEKSSRGYKRAHPLPLPDGAILLHLTQISPREVSYLDKTGNFFIAKGPQILKDADGNFGRSTRMFRHRADQQEHPYNQIRIPPAHLPEQDLLAVVDNPDADQGVLGFMSGEQTSSIELFRRGSEEQFKIGPMNGRILDVEVTDANPNQLLWLRKTKDGVTTLELIDFGELRLR